MQQVHTDAVTVEFKSPDGKNAVYVYASQVFAVTVLNSSGTTAIIGPANATMLVQGNVKDARDRVVAALTHAPNKGEA